MRSVATFVPSATLRLGKALLIILLLTLGFSSPALAQNPNLEILYPSDCAGVYNSSLSCTSNDIKINNVGQMTAGTVGRYGDVAQATITDCMEGALGYVDIALTTQLNANSRYDVLTWFGVEGNDPRAATVENCYVISLPNDPEAFDTTEDPPVPVILDHEGAPDACLDVDSSAAPITQYMYQIPFTCQDLASLDVDGNVVPVPDGEADIFALVTWFQNNTLTCGDNVDPGGVDLGQTMEPGVNPKCDISLLTGLNITVVTNPGIQIVKTPATQSVAPGGEASFTLTVTNEGDVDLDTVVVSDSNCGAAPTLDSGDVGSDGILGLTETWVYSCSKTNVQAGFTNTADVSAEEVGTDIVVTDDDSALVTLLAPNIEVIKNPATQAVNPGGTASFSIVVTNTGNTELINVELTDALAPGCNTSIGTLASGASTAPITCDVTGVAAAFTNEALVSGRPCVECDLVNDSDTAGVTLTSPAVQIVKTPDQTVSPGGTASFMLTVTNEGNVDLENVVVTDAMCDVAPAYQSGDIGVDSILATTETWIYTCSKANVLAAFTNTGNVTADPVGGGTGVSDSDTADVTMYTPSISVEKSPATQAVSPGGTASFSIVVTNTGDVDLENVELTDALEASCNTSIGALASGASTASILCGTTNVLAPFINQADVTGDPVGGGTAVTDFDTAEVTMNAPAVMIVKTPDQTIDIGDTAAFTLTVTNPGNVSLMSVAVTDAMCDAAPVLDSGDVGNDGILTTAETWVYSCSTANVLSPFTNTASVMASPVGGGLAVTDDDTADVSLNGRIVIALELLGPTGDLINFAGATVTSLTGGEEFGVDVVPGSYQTRTSRDAFALLGWLFQSFTCDDGDSIVDLSDLADLIANWNVAEGETVRCTLVLAAAPEEPDVPIPVNNPLALLLLLLALMATGWYFRPRTMR